QGCDVFGCEERRQIRGREFVRVRAVVREKKDDETLGVCRGTIEVIAVVGGVELRAAHNVLVLSEGYGAQEEKRECEFEQRRNGVPQGIESWRAKSKEGSTPRRPSMPAINATIQTSNEGTRFCLTVMEVAHISAKACLGLSRSKAGSSLRKPISSQEANWKKSVGLLRSE